MRKDLRPGDVVQVKPLEYMEDAANNLAQEWAEGLLAVVNIVTEWGVIAYAYIPNMPRPGLGKEELYLNWGTFVYIGVVVYPMFDERPGESGVLQEKK